MKNNDTIIQKQLLTCAYVVKNETIYYYTQYDTKLVKWDIAENTIDVIYTMPKGVYMDEKILLVNNTIFSLDVGGHYLYIFDLDEKNYKEVSIDCHTNNWGNFAGIFNEGESIVIIPTEREYFLRYDIKNEILSKHSTKAISSETIPYVFSLSNKCYVFSLKGNGYYSIENGKSLSIYYGKHECKMDFAAYYNDDKNLYSIDTKGDIFIWNNEEKRFDIILHTGIVDCGTFVVLNNYVVSLPVYPGGSIYKYDICNKQLIKYEEYPKDFDYIGEKTMSAYCRPVVTSGFLIFPTRSTNYALCVDKRKEELAWKKPIANEIVFFRAKMKREGIINEGIEYTINDLVEAL